MTQVKPCVSIGLPVFNGEPFLAEAVESLLQQSYPDFELILSDNASTDGTRQICEAIAARDPRVRYYRNPENIGAVQNWYRTFELSSGKYFTGAAHDDLYHPDFLLKCIEVLNQNPEVVICYSKTKVIDEQGKFVHDLDVEIDTSSSKPHVRLFNIIGVDYLCVQLFGLIRSEAFGSTQIYRGYYGCDRNTLAELCLLGKIYEIPEYLFFHRLHPKALGAAKNSGRSLQELLLLDPGTNWNASFPTLTRFKNYFSAVSRVPLSTSERLLCYAQLVRLVGEKSVSRLRRHWRPAVS